MKNLPIVFALFFTTSVFMACGGGGGDDDSGSSSSDAFPTLNACSEIGLSPKIISGNACNAQGASVVRIAAVLPEAGSAIAVPICTGTVVGDRKVLSAGHCFVEASIADRPVLGYGILKGEASSLDFVEASSVVFAPGFIESYTAENDRLFADVVVMTLSESAGLPSSPILTSRIPIDGDLALVYGYGQTAVDNPLENSFVELNGGLMRVQDVTPNHIFVRYDGEGSNVCFGDSGGPMFVTTGTAGYAIAGVVSQGSNDSCASGDVTTFINLAQTSLGAWVLSQL